MISFLTHLHHPWGEAATFSKSLIYFFLSLSLFHSICFSCCMLSVIAVVAFQLYATVCNEYANKIQQQNISHNNKTITITKKKELLSKKKTKKENNNSIISQHHHQIILIFSKHYNNGSLEFICHRWFWNHQQQQQQHNHGKT